jgi:multicomponent Na+:H+ antiporter subunit G
MPEVIGAIVALAGAALVFVAALGVLRMPDLYSRMHAATKAGALGSGLLVVAAAVAIGGISMSLRAAATVLFIVLTAPVAAHALGRAVYRNGSDR